MDGSHDALIGESDTYSRIGLLTTNRLASLCDASGRFIYRFDASTGSHLTGYNLLRHSGAAWALTVGGRQSNKMEGFDAVAVRALKWLERHHLRDIPHGYGIVESDGTVKLGGNALAIIAICSTSLVEDPRWIDLCKGLGAHILRSHQANGTFVSKIDALSGKRYPTISHYYNGQALLALVILWRLTGEDEILDLVSRSLSQRAAAGYGVVSQNHWMMLAVELLYAVRPAEYLIRYATRLARQISRDSQYRLRERCSPIACRSEALLAFCRLALVYRAPLKAADIDSALSTTRTNLGLQLRDALPDGSFIRGGGDAEVRIDYLQHNLMALLSYSNVTAILRARGATDGHVM